MRKVFFFLVFLNSFAFAQQPEKIYGKNKVLHSNEYYLEQKELWKKETEKNPGDAKAWYNYYRADRNAYIVGEETDSLNTKGINRFMRLSKIVAEMKAHVPESAEYYFTEWLNGNNDLLLLPSLEKAHALSPQWPEPLLSLAYCYEICGNEKLRDQYAKAYYQSKDFSEGLLIYGKNLLAGLAPNAIILTEGDKDTDAIMLLQHGEGIRNDVRLVNLNLLMNPNYRELIFRDLKIPAWIINPYKDDSEYNRYRRTVILQIAKNKDQRPVYAATSVSDPYTEALVAKKNMFNTGLAKLYSKKKVDSIALIKMNYDNLYSLDYLWNYPKGDISEEMVHRFNMNYLPALEELISYYLNKHDPKAGTYKLLADKIRADSPDK